MFSNKNPEVLVSIVVIAYNSSNTILETLESIKSQSYTKIEVIISDDCSTDNTTEVCNKWLEVNKVRFVRTRLITSAVNTGIPANCNRGLKSAKGEWVKIIAGDDALIESCIANNIDFSTSMNDINCIHSGCEYYNEQLISENYKGKSNYKAHPFNSMNITAKEQYHLILNRSNGIVAPTIFIRRKTIMSIGGFDESIKKIEDIPLWISLTSAGHKIFYLDSVTVKYRIHAASVQRGYKTFMNESYARELILFNKKYIKGEIKHLLYIRRYVGLVIIIILNKAGLNNNTRLSKILFKVTNKFR